MARPVKPKKNTFTEEQKKQALKLWLEGKTDKEIETITKVNTNAIRQMRHRYNWEQFRLSPTEVDTETRQLTLDQALQNIDATVKGHFYGYRKIRLKVLEKLPTAQTTLQILQLAQALDIAVKGERQALGIESKSNEPREIEINLNIKRPNFQDGQVIDVDAEVIDPVLAQLEDLDIREDEIIKARPGEEEDELPLLEAGDTDQPPEDDEDDWEDGWE